MDKHYKGKNEERIRLHLDQLDEVMATAEQQMVHYQDLMVKHYNARSNFNTLASRTLFWEKWPWPQMISHKES